MKTEGGVYIRFKHEHGEWPQAIYVRGYRIEQTCTRRTQCELVEGPRDHEVVLASGEAYCSPDDNYDAEIGRQVALADAVRRLPKRSHVGAEALAAYLHRPGAQIWLLGKDGHPLPGAVTSRRRAA